MRYGIEINDGYGWGGPAGYIQLTATTDTGARRQYNAYRRAYPGVTCRLRFFRSSDHCSGILD